MSTFKYLTKVKHPWPHALYFSLVPDCNIGMKEAGSEDNSIEACMATYFLLSYLNCIVTDGCSVIDSRNYAHC